MVDSSSSDTLDSDALDSDDESELHYEAVEPWAIIALFVALAAPLALLAPVLWFVPLLAILIGVIALRKIGRTPGRSGRAMVLVALALSTFFLSTAAAQLLSTQWMLARQARSVADQFVEFLRQGSPEKALMLYRPPDSRHPLDDELWTYYQRNDDARAELKKLVDHPAIRMILALGDRAQIRCFRTAGVGAEDEVAQADLWYTITFDDTDGRKKTYLLGVLMERRPTEDGLLNPWRVKNFAGGIDPGAR